ncbi:hypothetical protein ACIQF8_01255 [Pseudarthrobacter sp. NPDC092184]|uniref:hypothetical protein n=1 Tax=unclassified Pseudarthrobacter TaxID=2647000 RepID=UPI0037FB1851
MPGTPSKEVAHARGVVAGLSRSRALDDPEFVAARQELKAAKLAAFVSKAVAEAPPLTPEQRDRIAGLLRPQSGGAA